MKKLLNFPIAWHLTIISNKITLLNNCTVRLSTKHKQKHKQQKPNKFAHEIQVTTPGKTLAGKPILSLFLLLKILGSHPGIMAHQRITMLQLIV
jgi:hypothetical protein